MLGYMGQEGSGGGPGIDAKGLGLNPVYEKCMSLYKKASLHGNPNVKTSLEVSGQQAHVTVTV